MNIISTYQIPFNYEYLAFLILGFVGVSYLIITKIQKLSSSDRFSSFFLRFSIFNFLPEQWKVRFYTILNHPIYKLWSKSLIIGSLWLIVTKLLIGAYLNVWIRIGLLIIYTLISMGLNLREKIKKPIKKLLCKCLGQQFYFYGFGDLDKEDYQMSSVLDLKNPYLVLLYTIKFELRWFIQYLFQRFYIFISYIRFYSDNHPILYLILYYTLFFGVIYTDTGYLLAYTSLFFIITRLLVYIEENNWGEVKIKMKEDGKNMKLGTKKLKITKRNVMIYVFWNLRNLTDDILNYKRSQEILEDMNFLHEFAPFFAYLYGDDLPFEYEDDVKEDTSEVLLSMFPIYSIFKSNFNLISTQIDHRNNIIAKVNPYYNEVKKLLESQNGHDGQLAFYHFYEKEKEKYRLYFSVFTSEKDNNYNQTLFGTIARIQTASSISCEFPSFFLESHSLSDLEKQNKELYQYNSNPPKFLSEKNFSPDIHNNSLNLTLLLKTFPNNYLLKEIINDSLKNMRVVKTNRVFNTENHTFAIYINEMLKGNYNVAREILFDIREVLEKNYQAMFSLKKQFLKKDGRPLNDNELKQDKHLLNAKSHLNRCMELLNKHESFYFQYIYENLRILEKNEEEELVVYIKVYEEHGDKFFNIFGDKKSLKEYSENKPIKVINLITKREIRGKKSEIEAFLGIDSRNTNILKIEHSNETPLLDSLKQSLKAKEWDEKKYSQNQTRKNPENPPEDGDAGPY